MFKVVIYIVLTAYSVKAQNYCDLSCERSGIIYENTVCNRQNVKCGASPYCVDFREFYLNDEQIASVVDYHNFLRNQVAIGNETRGNQPPAANMNILRHNPELQYGAQCWTNNCQFEHDKCRKIPKYKNVGQNLSKYITTANDININEVLKSLIQGWYNEVQYYDNSRLKAYKNIGGPAVGHYTQLVWAETKEVGCGLTSYREGGNIVYLFGCNYGPAGNMQGSPIYEVGPTASHCSNGVDSKYPGLCL